MYLNFRDSLTNTDQFIIVIEIIPTRGAVKKDVGEIIDFAQKAADYGKITALSLTDNPGGNPRLSPDVLGRDIKHKGMDVIIHLSCKDYNRNGIESRAYQLSRLGLENTLALTGDYPVEGYNGIAKPTFDIDSIMLLKMLNDMNNGLKIPGRKPGTFETIEKTDFYVGAAVSNFKKYESEVMNQYYKLHKKIKYGAKFIITQVGYDARKFDELIRYMRENDLNVPLIGYVYVLTRGVARSMNRGEVPGCVVTDEFLGWIEKNAKAPDKGKSARLELAAKQIAILKGLGYRGAYIGGYGLKFDDVVKIIERFEQIAPQWLDFVKEINFNQKGEFYYYRYDPKTGLNIDEKNVNVNTPSHKAPLGYKLMRKLHHIFFDENVRAFKLYQKICKKIDKKESRKKILYFFEKAIKDITSNCKECGDCALPEMAFLCPESQCAKFLRNGPCGGSFEGMCEVDFTLPCVWVKIYDRLKAYGEEKQILEQEVISRNWDLNKTSSWLNFFLGRDHQKVKIE